ncbi:PREDICTED: HAUS augmin-like complex subunit 6 [Chlamydotis macqueenii]|uniref:HAUS augmin-like complex subunit 6 n=1 Tax=Chlamydotis macqueenii TaxID=187382 RepID=UPI00052994CD|nr:PREDICTED: HAUS augmin-like complex subunit 6 [Chlamydotis macqueenii]
MFDIANNRAFQVITLFLFAKLDVSRAAETFRDCSFSVGSFADAEFRKKCYMWLKDIANEDKNCLPYIAPSSFVFPTGPKFIQLLYQLARYVVISDMKMNYTDTDIPFAEAVKSTPEDMYMANARCRVAYNKLLQTFQKEDFVIQEYEKKAQLLIKEINQIKSEYAVLQMQSCKMKQEDQNKTDKTERIQKVRSMWSLIMEMLTSLKKEKEVVDSVLDVLEGSVDQCVLDGTNVVFSVPQLLAHRVESDVHQLCTGNLYEAEKLNFLTVIQLLNEALRTLRGEHCQSEVNQQLQIIEDKVTVQKNVLEDLEAKRLKMEQQHSVSTSVNISTNQEDWEVKWKSFLGLCPFNLILDQDLRLDFLRASPPCSFTFPEDDEGSMFCQYLESVSDVCDSTNEVCYDEKDDETSETVMDKSTPPPRCLLSPTHPRISSVPLELSKASENRDVLIEKLHTETCKEEEKPMLSRTLKNEKDESGTSEMLENASDHVIQAESPVKEEDLLKKARDELAEEVAKTVVSESPQSDEGKRMALEDLISSLASNPFLTRKQIPRTPENLLTDIRSSWRKAIQAEGSSDTELALTEVMVEETPMNAGPVTQKAADSRLACSTAASLLPDFNPPLTEMKSHLSSTEFRPQEHMGISHITESPVLGTSGMQESERTEAQVLKCNNLQKSSVEDPEEQTSQYVKKSMNSLDIWSENDSRTTVLPSDHFQNSLTDGMLHYNVSSLSSTNCKAAHLGILDETLPEELDSIDSNKSASSGSDLDVIDSACVTGGLENKGDIKISKLDLQSVFNRDKALEKTASKSEDELHQTHNGGESGSCRSDINLSPEKRERDELCRPLELFCLEEEFTKAPSPKFLNERKYSLSSLLVSCQHLEEMASMVHEVPLDLVDKLKGKGQLDEKPGMKEPSSG